MAESKGEGALGICDIIYIWFESEIINSYESWHWGWGYCSHSYCQRHSALWASSRSASWGPTAAEPIVGLERPISTSDRRRRRRLRWRQKIEISSRASSPALTPRPSVAKTWNLEEPSELSRQRLESANNWPLAALFVSRGSVAWRAADDRATSEGCSEICCLDRFSNLVLDFAVIAFRIVYVSTANTKTVRKPLVKYVGDKINYEKSKKQTASYVASRPCSIWSTVASRTRRWRSRSRFLYRSFRLASLSRR